MICTAESRTGREEPPIGLAGRAALQQRIPTENITRQMRLALCGAAAWTVHGV